MKIPLTQLMVRQPFNKITLGFLSGQVPSWFVGIFYEDKIELFDAVWVTEIVIHGQI
jgi:hypothetical protein